MAAGRDILDHLTEQYNQMTKANKRIADYIFSHQTEAQYMSISTLAEECEVSVATVTRFCREMGFSGYNAFKLELAKAESARLEADEELQGLDVSVSGSYKDLLGRLYRQHSDSILKTMEKLDEASIRKAVECLSQAARVLCYGQGGSMVCAMAAYTRFATITGKFICVQDSHLQAMGAALSGPSDVLLYFSYSGSTHEVVETLKIARKNRTKVILVTHFQNSPASPYADVILLCGPIEDPRQSGSMYVKVAQMFIIDVLYQQYRVLDQISSDRNRELTLEAISRKIL